MMKSMSAMRPDYRQRGFSIVSAIFLLVVLSALGAFMLTFSNVQQMTSAQDVQGSRAYQAARAGIEWGAYQILQNSGSCAASTTVPLGGNLSGFTLIVDCSKTTTTEAGNTVNIFQLTATATTGTVGSTTYIERQVKATIEK
jgi:MSHA biogenesis protein MshP